MKFFIILLLGIVALIGGGMLLAWSWWISDLIQSGQIERMAREAGHFERINYDNLFSQIIQLRFWGIGLIGIGIGLLITSVVTRKKQ